MDNMENRELAKEYSDITGGGQKVEIPPVHAGEAKDFTRDMSLPLDDVLEKISANEYEKNIEQNHGYLNEWKSLVGETDDKQAFSEAYRDYLINPEKLKNEKPEQYDFINQHVFNGKEFVNQQKNVDINGDADQKDVQKVISFGSTYNYCTRSTCSGWARDGEYINC